MSSVFDYVFGQYAGYRPWMIALEGVAVCFSIASVLFSLKNRVLVFPTGIVSTLLFVILLYHWNLLGDMIINGYYFIMSIYGWYIWTSSSDGYKQTPITRTGKRQWWKSLGIVVLAAIGIYFLYRFRERLEGLVSYIDMLTTGIFFAGMWLMAKRKLEHWLVLMAGNLISIPLYFYKGLVFSSLLYVFLAIIAWVGFKRWKGYLNKRLSLENA